MVGCVSCYGLCDVLCICLGDNIDEPSVFGELVVEVRDPRAFYTLYKSLKQVQPIVEKIIGLVKAYDLPQMISTHRAMTRRIARLKKLLKILDTIDLEVKTFSGLCYISYKKLYRPVVEILENIIDVMEYFKNDVHRDRDRVHQYLYPIIHSALDVMKHTPTIIYSPWFTSLPRIEYEVVGYRIELKIETSKTYRVFYISDMEFEKLLEKPPEQVKKILNEIIEKRLKRIRKRKIKPRSWIPWKTIEEVRG